VEERPVQGRVSWEPPRNAALAGPLFHREVANGKRFEDRFI